MSHEPITWVTAHPLGRWVAVADFEGRILVWAPSEGRIVAQQKLSSRVRRVEWTADAKYFVAIEQDSDALHVFAPDGSSALPPIATGHEDVRALAVHPSKPWVATVGNDSHVRVWDLEKRSAIYEKKTLHPGSACALSETLVAVGSEVGEFDVWDFIEQKPKAGGEVFADAYVGAMAFSPDGKSLVMGGSKGKLLRFETSGKWTCTHDWKERPPRPIATNDIRYRDENTWVAAHSDDRATLSKRPADGTPEDLGSAFWLERKKPWDPEFIVSSACFVPGTDTVITAHFSGRLRVFTRSISDLYLRRGDVLFDPETGAPQMFGSVADVFRNAKPAPKLENAVAIGDREHAAASVDEMQFAASFHPCPTCGAAPSDLVVSGEGEARVLRGDCQFCGRPATFTFFFRPPPKSNEPIASTILEPRVLAAELARLEEMGIDERTRGRALSCIDHLMRFPLYYKGNEGDAIVALREKLLADVRAPAPRTPPLAANIDTIVRGLFFSGDPPKNLGELEKLLGVEGATDVTKLWPSRMTELARQGFVTKIAMRPIWDIHHQERPKDPLLAEWCAVFAGGASVFQQALRRAFGPPSVRPHCHVYGKHWVVRTRGDEIELTWGERIPDWAQHVDPKVRERALRTLAEALTNGTDLTQAAGSISPDAGIAPRESTPGAVTQEFVPAIKVLELAQILGWPEIVGQSRDFHASVHTVELLSGGSPKLGRFAVDMTLEGSPTGEPLDRTKPIHVWKRRFGPDDLVRYWQIRG